MEAIKRHWKSLLIFSIAFICYSNTFNHTFVLDDDVVYLKNSFVQNGFGGLKDIFSHGFLYGFNQRNDQSYRPLVLANFAIEHQIFGNNPRAHHIIGVLLYSLLCVLVFHFLLKLLNKSYWLAFWISLIYALHPIHTEVVANIKGRDEILHALFMLASLINLLNYIDYKKQSQLIYSLSFLFLALLCKEMAVTAIGFIPIVLYVFRELSVQASLKKTAYYLAPLGLYFFMRNAILDDLAFEEKMTVINNTLAAASSWQEHIATAVIIFFKYLQLLVFPNDLSWDYSIPYFQIVDFSNTKALVFSVLLISGIIGAIIYAIKKRSDISAAFLFFIIPFSIVSNFFILIGCTLGERFMFFPSLGFLLFIALIIQWTFKQLKISNRQKHELSFILIIPLIALGWKTVDRNKDWKNNETLFRSAMEVTPNNSRAVAAYASIFRSNAESSNDPNYRMQQFKEAIKWYLESAKLHGNVSDTWYNLGVSYLGINLKIEAKQVFEKALEIDPTHINALNNIGVIYFQNKDFQNAKNVFEQTLKYNINFASGHANLGAVHHNLGNLELAKTYYQNALKLNPQDQNTRMNLSKLQ